MVKYIGHLDPFNVLQLRLRERINKFREIPDIFCRREPNAPDITTELGVDVHDWAELRRRREFELLQNYGNVASAGLNPTLPGSQDRSSALDRISLRPLARNIKTAQTKSKGGRSYTSKYRGVHQTFPTRRWEAQFRRNGRPTSLGCFDHEDEAARAYDRMMLWCELHGATGVKGGVTNFDISEYENDVHWLQAVTQDELVQILRSDGRRQAAERAQKQRRRSSQSINQGQAHGRQHQSHSGDAGNSDPTANAAALLST